MRFWRRKQRERDLDDEIQAHINLEIQQRIERGESAEDAREGAYREFGSVALVKEVTRGMWYGAFLDRLSQDLRHMVRYTWNTFRKEPVPSIVTILTLTLVLAAVTIVFGAMRALMFGNRPGAGHPNGLVDFVNISSDGKPSEYLTYPSYLDYRNRSTGLSGIAAYTGFQDARLQLGSRTEGVRMAGITGNYFEVLEIKPSRGRSLTLADDTDAAEPVAIIGYRLWADRFKSDESIIGSRVLIDSRPFTLIGVGPKAFLGTDVFREDLWIPIAKHPDRDLRTNRSTPTIRVTGRLKDGVPLRTAQASVNIVTGILEREHPKEKGRRIHLLNRWYQAADNEVLAEGLAAMCLTVLLVACANIAVIGLSRALSRRSEIIVRLALGAPRRRIAFQVLLETVGVFLPAGILATLATSRFSLLEAIHIWGMPDIDVTPEAHVILIVLGITFLAAIVSGLTPALDAARTDLTGSLKDQPSTGGRRRLRLQSVLLVVQVAVSVALLIVGGLYFRTLHYISLQRGFDPSNLYLVGLNFSTDGNNNDKHRQFVYQLEQRVAELPPVTGVTVSEGIPSTGTIWAEASLRRTPYGQRSDKPELETKSNYVAPGYFKTLGIPLLQGRDFTSFDSPARHGGVAIVSESLARRMWPDGNAIGKKLFEHCAPEQWSCEPEVIGIVADTAVNTGLEPLLYRPISQQIYSQIVLAYRTSQPESVLRAIRTIVPDLSSDALIAETPSAADAMHNVLMNQYIGIWGSGILGLFTVILTALGIYGVASYSARARTREIGIRTALGARPNRVVYLIIRRSVVLSCIGLAAGCAAGLAVVKFIPPEIGFYGVHPFDLPAYAAATLVVLMITFLACYVPSVRAAKADPLAVLRHE